MPILFNEDDHFDFEKEENNFAAAIAVHAPEERFAISLARSSNQSVIPTRR